MAKAFGGMAAPTMAAVTANGSPGGIRPMARPAGLGGVETAQAKPQGGFLAQQFGAQGSDTRYNTAMQMLQSAMSGAQGTTNPALAFLAPLLGGVIGAKVQGQRDGYLSQQQDQMTRGLLGDNLNPQAQQALGVLNNPNAPDYLKAIAQTMFKDNAVPVGQMAAPARRSGGGASNSGTRGGERPQKLTYISRDPDGVVRGYNARTGKREVVPNADAPAPTPAAAPSLPPLPPDPVIPRDPSGLNDDEFLNALGVN